MFGYEIDENLKQKCYFGVEEDVVEPFNFGGLQGEQCLYLVLQGVFLLEDGVIVVSSKLCIVSDSRAVGIQKSRNQLQDDHCYLKYLISYSVSSNDYKMLKYFKARRTSFPLAYPLYRRFTAARHFNERQRSLKLLFRDNSESQSIL